MDAVGLVTLWQAGHHVVRVEVGAFPSAEAARRFCAQSLQLTRDLAGERVVLMNAIGETLVVASDEQVLVFQLTPQILRDFGASPELLCSHSKYGHLLLPIADFHRYGGFGSFHWLACAVGEPVAAEVDRAAR